MGSRVRCKEYPLHSVVVRPSELDDAHALAPRLEQNDVDELDAWGLAPLDALYMGIQQSSPCWTACLSGVPIAVFGRSGKGVWMLASPDLKRVRKLFLRECAFWLNELHQGAPYLHNHIDARQVNHIDWLLNLGFTMSADTQALGVHGEQFHYFWRMDPCVSS